MTDDWELAYKICAHCEKDYPRDEVFQMAPKRIAGKPCCCKPCRKLYDAGIHPHQVPSNYRELQNRGFGGNSDANANKNIELGGNYNSSVMYPKTPGSKGGGASEDMAKIWNGKSGALRKRVYEYLLASPAAGAEDIAAALNEDADNVSPRCSELVAFGLVEKGPRTARTRRGNPAHVYIARTAKAEAA